MEMVNGDRGRVNRDEWQAHGWLCVRRMGTARQLTSPIPTCWQIRGSAYLAKHQQGELENFHSIQSTQFAPAGGQRPKTRPGQKKETPAQWAAAAESTAACSTLSMADPGSRMSMDPLLCSIAL
jgi:hypothetical protein